MTKILIITLFMVRAFADTVTLENIFSENIFIGGVSCSAVSSAEEAPGGYLNEASQVYLQADIKTLAKQKVKLSPTCAQGGGDCQCYALYVSEKSIDNLNSFYQVFAEDKKTLYWIKAPKSETKKIDALATEAQIADLNLRDPNTDVYLTEGAISAPTQAAVASYVKFSQLNAIPKEISEQITKDNLGLSYYLYIEIPSTEAQQGVNTKIPSIDFWRSTEPNAAAKNLDQFKLYEYVTGEQIQAQARVQPYQWKVRVLKKEGERYLIAANTAQTNTNLAAYSPEMMTEENLTYSWIKINNLKTKIENPNLDEKKIEKSPLKLTQAYEAKQSKIIKGKSYTHIQESLLLVDPLNQNGSPDNVATKKIKIRDFWIKTFDDKNRINFWLAQKPGC